MSSAFNYTVVPTTDELVSLPAFHAIVWLGFGLCVLALGIRLYIRFSCFHRLLVDDYLMIVALVLLHIQDQLYLKQIYLLQNVSNGVVAPGSDFLPNIQKGLRGFGIAILLCYVGIWLIKLNFIFFFKRLGAQLTTYLVFWWFVLIFTIACGVVSIDLWQFKCLFGPIDYIVTVCPTTANIEKTYTFFKISCIEDVITDALIICFPVSVLWHIQISTRKKIALAALFSLVAFTIAVTIVRGSIFGGVYKPVEYSNKKEMNVTWMWFWFTIEYTVSFIIACIVSFRALFTQKRRRADVQEHEDRERRHAEAQGSPAAVGTGGTFMRRAGRFHNSLLDTLRSTERGDDLNSSRLPMPPSPKLSLDFSRDVKDQVSSMIGPANYVSTGKADSIEASSRV